MISLPPPQPYKTLWAALAPSRKYAANKAMCHNTSIFKPFNRTYYAYVEHNMNIILKICNNFLYYTAYYTSN